MLRPKKGIRQLGCCQGCPGGFSDTILVDDEKYIVKNGPCPMSLACTYACSGLTAYSALLKAGAGGPHLGPLTSDDWLMIIGAGGLGLNAVVEAHLATPANVLVVDQIQEKLDAAMEAGAHDVVSSAGFQFDVQTDTNYAGFGAESNDVVLAIMEKTGGGPRAVIDFVGAPGTINLGMRSVRRDGKVVVVGLFDGEAVMKTGTVAGSGKQLQGSNVSTLAEFKDLMGHVRDGKVRPIPIQTRPIAAANDALADMAARRIVGRVVLTHDAPARI